MPKIVHSSQLMIHRLRKKTTNHEQLTTNRKSKGFTLIEILVVIAIMAVLAGGLLYSTNNARDKGKDARRKADLNALGTALTTYYADFRHYPPTSPTAPLDYVSDTTAPWVPDLETYLNKLPKDPLQAGLLAPLAGIFENGKKIAGGGLAWLTTNKTAAQKPKGQVAAAGTGNLGNTNAGTNYDTWGSGNLYGTKFKMGADNGTTTTMKVYINSPIIDTTTNNKFELAIYYDLNGKPDIPVDYARGQGTVTGAGWNSITFSSPVTLYSNTTYWLLYSKNAPGSTTNAAMFEGTGGANSYYIDPWSFGSTLPMNPTCCPQSNLKYSIYVPYTINSNMYSSVVLAPLDDGKRQSNPDMYESGIPDNPTGTYWGCPNNHRSNYYRFTGINIPHDATINTAKITFTPLNNDNTSKAVNSTYPLTTFKSILKGEIADNATPVSDADMASPATNFNYRVNNRLTSDADSVVWNDVPKWYDNGNPLPPGATEKDISNIIRKIVNRGTWDETDSAINIFWLDLTPDGQNPCQGRIGVSYEGSLPGLPPSRNLGAPPRLTITWDTTPPGTCNDPLATNFGGALPCTYPPSSTTGACNDKTTNVYCYRTSTDKKVYVLWAKLENANDPGLSTNPDALCRQTDPDFLNVPANTSPFKNLGKPDNSDFNYCLKSPQ